LPVFYYNFITLFSTINHILHPG